jgi:PEP-CTERM motif
MSSFGQWIRRLSRNSGGLLGVLCLALSCSAQAATYNAVNDFSIANNPNGVWSYLYNHGTTTNLLPQTVVGPDTIYWWNGGSQPNSAIILKNVTCCTVIDGFVVIPTDHLDMDPQSLSYVDLRFTAPTASSYSITGDFLGIDLFEVAHPVEITVNGTIVFSNTISSDNQSAPFSLIVSLQKGDTVDFNNLTSPITYAFLSTGLAATINTPEPGSLLLLGSGIISLAGILRRKFNF